MGVEMAFVAASPHPFAKTSSKTAMRLLSIAN